MSKELLAINVNEHTEKKNGLTYLSWAWAWAEVLKIDPHATWRVATFQADPDATSILCSMPDGTAFVGVYATIKGIERECMLPVMDHRNKAIPKPNAFDVNKAIMRCLAKAIAMHGLGLYIYAGEDLPEADDAPEPKSKRTGVMADVLAALPELDEADALYYAELADNVETLFTAQGIGVALDRIDAEGLENEQKLYLNARLGSKVRSALKTESKARREATGSPIEAPAK